MVNVLGAVSLWGLGVVVGVIGVATLLYWILDEWREANNATEVVERVGERSGSAVVVGSGVLLTIGDQLIQLVADLVGMIDAPVVVGHVVGGVLGWLGLQGTITTRQFVIGFVVVTVVALIWRASLTRGRGI
ncbi:hypothetical protein ACOZ4L_02715 [Haloplanus ruber]|uniref:Uncharacterized protein n=1 Tax=Haloplanus ruber TaxID=869892 RepID=A0ABD6CZJ6_9EURY|nr:hypothetical protein [Haloplanus ruber]